MLKLFILVCSIFFLVNSNLIAQASNKFVDERDGKVYMVTMVGNQKWMAQNLNFNTENSWCYENKDKNGELYGRLYTWNAANIACPAGWHLPSDEEWQELEKFLGMDFSELTKSNTWRGTDQGHRLISDTTISFNILLSGYRNPPSNYNLLKSQAFFWTSSEKSGSAWFRQIYEGSAQIFRHTRPTSWAFSVRCISDQQNK
jgi:uncharacterized protein (TIGR02145 family)